MASETLRELCDKYKLDPKRVRAKLRSALATGKLKLKHTHRQNWEMNAQLRQFVIGINKGAKLSTPSKKSAKKSVKKAAPKKAAKTTKKKQEDTPAPQAA